MRIKGLFRDIYSFVSELRYIADWLAFPYHTYFNGLETQTNYRVPLELVELVFLQSQERVSFLLQQVDLFIRGNRYLSVVHCDGSVV